MHSRMARAWALAGVAFVFASAPGRGSAQITPETVSVELAAGEASAPSPAQITLPTVLPRVDLVIAVDTTGSMGGAINALRLEINKLLANLVAAGAVDLAAAVVSFEDYQGSYTSCGYSGYYGDPTMDSPFRVNQPMSTDLSPTGPVVTAVTGLKLGYGGDGPQNYSRIMFEATKSDNGIGFRAGAQRILVLFGDYNPHDCALKTGADPGRDAIVGTADDLTLYGPTGVLAGLKDKGVKLVAVHSGGYIDLWNSLTALAGGSAVKIGGDGTVPSGVDLATLILGEITDMTMDVGVTRSCQAGGDVLVDKGAGYGPALSWSAVAGGTTLAFNEIAALSTGVPGGETRTCVVEANATAAGGTPQFIGAQVVSIKAKETLQKVGIQVKGGASTINLGSKGVTPVYLLGSATFDPATADIKTVKLAAGTCAAAGAALLTTGAAAIPGTGTEDANEDGIADRVIRFETEDVAAPGAGGVTVATTVVHMAGLTTAGLPFCGEDGARMIDPPAKKMKAELLKKELKMKKIKDAKKKPIGIIKKGTKKPIEILPIKTVLK